MKNILTILIFLLFLTSPLSVQYTQTGLQFQREVLGKELCEDDDEDCKEDEDEDEDEDEEDSDEDGDRDENAENNEDSIITVD
ncbi:uncharacterized protein METZ01_LOCUS228683, partial [marine metagenome]